MFRSLLSASPKTHPLRLASTICLCALASSLLAQRSPTPPSLLKDLNPGGDPLSEISEISDWINGQALIGYSDAAAGRGLFVTNGASQTFLVGTSPNGLAGLPTNFTRFGTNRWAFTARNELWVSDGTKAGTRRVLQALAEPFRLTALGNDLLFFAPTRASGFELMRTDGTVQGTRVVRDIAPGTMSSATRRPNRLEDRMTVLNGRAYFGASQNPVDQQLWSTDGTALGTRVVMDLAPGSNNGTPRFLARSIGRVFTVTAELPAALWISDGTAVGTQLVRRFSEVLAMEPIATGVALHTRDGLWISSGTAATTFRLTTTPYAVGAAIGQTGTSFWAIASLAGAASRVYYGNTRSGLAQLGQIANPTVSRAPVVHTIGNRALIQADNSALWVASPTTLTRLTTGSKLVIQRSSIAQTLFANNQDLWVTDRTVPGTRRSWTGSRRPRSSTPTGLVDLDGVTIFQATDPGGQRLYFRTDGTSAGTYALGSLANGAKVGALRGQVPIRAGDSVYWADLHRPNGVIWRTRGRRNDVELAYVSGSGMSISSAFELGGALHFTRNGTGTSELWIIDPTTSTPRRLVVRPDPILTGAEYRGVVHWIESTTTGSAWYRLDSNGSPRLLAPTKQRMLYAKMFATQDRLFGSLGGDLFSTDGTASGTIQVRSQSTQVVSGLTTDTHFFFLGTDPVHGREPWVSDGTAAGTKLLRDVLPGPGHSNGSHWVRIGPRVAFTANTPQGRRAFFTDGTRAGTRPVELAGPNRALNVLGNIFAMGNRHIVFSAIDANGIRLFQSDGTPSGTRAVPGAGGVVPTSVALSNGRALLDMADVQVGRELFEYWPGATTQRTGTACAGGGRRPRLVTSDPILGRTLVVRADDLPSGPGRNGALVFMPPLRQSTPLLGTRCIAHGDWTRMVVLGSFAARSPAWTFQAVLPNLPAADRLQAIVRVVVSPTDGPLFGDLTNAVRLTFGD